MFFKQYLLVIVIAIGLLACFINIETIRFFPSWFDEAFFANISFNYAQGDGLKLDLIPGDFKGEIYLYGPVYFYIQAILIKYFGLKVFVFRLINLLASYIIIWLISCVLNREGLKRNYLILFVLATLVDVSFNRNAVSGRMDMLAVMFVSLALYLTKIQSIKGNNFIFKFFFYLMIGVVSGAAYLTTPRALFLLPLVFLSAVHFLFIKPSIYPIHRTWVLFVVAITAFLLPILMWIQYVGGINAYSALFNGDTIAPSHIGPSLFRSSYDNIGICLMLCLLIINFRKVFKDPLLISLFITYIIFSVFVKEVGPYAAMIMPFVLATIVLIVAKSDYNLYMKGSILALVLIPGLLLLSLRGIDLYLNSDCRDSKKVISELNQVLKNDTKIVAPSKYYLFLAEKGRKVVTFEYSKLEKSSVIKDADLIITNSSDKEFLISKGYKRTVQFVCNPYRVPLLPETFYSRSVFNEGLYIK